MKATEEMKIEAPGPEGSSGAPLAPPGPGEGKGPGPGPGPEAKGTLACQEADQPQASPKAAEGHTLFDQATARIMGSRLGIYDGQDWVGPTQEVRWSLGEQMVEEARRLREMGQLEEGLALSLHMGKEPPLEPLEAFGRFEAGLQALGPGMHAQGSVPEPPEAGQSQENIESANPSGAPSPSQGAEGHPGLPPEGEPEPFPPDKSPPDYGEQLSFEGWVPEDPKGLEEA